MVFVEHIRDAEGINLFPFAVSGSEREGERREGVDVRCRYSRLSPLN